MAQDVQKPYDRKEFASALILNALVQPFNIVILTVMLVVGLLLHVFPIVAPIAVVVYAIAVARTFFDEDEANKVLDRVRGKRGETAEKSVQRLNPALLAPPIRDKMEQALSREARIRDAIERADLPYAEVSSEVDGFVRTMESTAKRAQLLWEGLHDAPPEQIQLRLQQLQASNNPGKADLIEALNSQLAVMQKMEGQLERFYDEMERMVIELDTIRGQLVSVSASTDSQNQQQLAGEVRALRDQMGAVADGMSEAYEKPTALPSS